ncbi:MAG: serine hydrolase [Vicinamibacteria bacterium]|nr:serine hydrolase [Vicinamibacteria bacterium]
MRTKLMLSRGAMALAFVSLAAPAVPAPAVKSDRRIAADIERYMRAAVEVERFTGSILVARDGKPIISKGYGFANVEFDAPNTPATVFRLASLTKQFTAAAIMILQERGKLSVADPACKHLAACPPAWQPLTIHHLLTMTHGIPGVSALELGPLRGLPVPWDQWQEATGKKPLEFEPGTKFRYQNAGYTLLGFIIERVSGKPYGEFLQENIFAPLGMTRTGYEDPLRIIRNRAIGYKQMPGDPITNVPYREVVGMYAAGGVYSTTKDLLRWDQALYSDRILSKRSRDEMFTPFRDMQPGRGYAYGLWSSREFGRLRLAHGGNATGFITYFARYPEDRVTVIVLSNNERGSAGKISNDLSAITFGEPYEIPRERREITVAPSLLEQYVGQYEFQYPETSYTITNEGGKLMLLEPGYPKDQMFPESETEFFSKAFDVQIRFVKDDSGNVTGVVVRQNDSTLFEVMNGRKVQPGLKPRA